MVQMQVLIVLRRAKTGEIKTLTVYSDATGYFPLETIIKDGARSIKTFTGFLNIAPFPTKMWWDSLEWEVVEIEGQPAGYHGPRQQ